MLAEVDKAPRHAQTSGQGSEGYYIISRFDDVVFVMEDVDAASKVVRADASFKKFGLS